jgi:hypothetical protein
MKCIFCDTDMRVEQRHTDQTVDKLTLPGIAWCPSCLKWWHVTTDETPKPEKKE